MNTVLRWIKISRASLWLALLLAWSPALAREDLTATVRPAGRLVNGSQSVEVQVRVRCALEGVEVLEAFVYVVQDGNQSSFAGLPVTCGRKSGMQVFKVTVSAFDFPFHRGAARATVFILTEDPLTHETISADVSEPLKLR
jgi:hypothetical protein